MPYVGYEEQRNQLKEVLRGQLPHIGSRVVQTGLDDIEEFGIQREVAERIISTPEFLRQIPSYEVIGAVVEGYTHQVLGLNGYSAKVEHSFAGDLVHSLYLPHVDLWRGDRRFSEVVGRAMPEYGVKIVSTLTGLPDAINTWNSGSR